MIKTIKAFRNQGRQYIPDLEKAELPKIFRGRPIISELSVNQSDFAGLCPTGAIMFDPFRIDLGKCTFCGECAFTHPDKIQFTNDHKIATNDRNRLVIKEGEDLPIKLNQDLIRKKIKEYFHSSLKLRQVSAAGDNSTELELNASDNVNFDISRFGIEFVASPRHADGIVITGPISQNMAEPLEICYNATPQPKIIILAGVDAISGGIFSDSPALNRSFLDNHIVDLYVPGNPPHPLTFINGVLDLIRKRKST
jgi:Ni,Fe-hydrogenase III small subunit